MRHQPLSALLALGGLLCAGALSACEIPPSYVDRNDVDDGFARGAYKTVCKGLEMKEDDVRRYATERLVKVTEPISQECVCANIVDEKKGTWDDAIANGLTGTDRDELASCFTAEVLKPGAERQVEAVAILAKIPAKASRDALVSLATGQFDSEVRAAATRAIGGDATYKAELLKLAADSDEAVRSAAIGSMHSIKGDDSVVALLEKTLAEDASGSVRASALTSLKALQGTKADEAICKAMMEDADGTVRAAAVSAFRGTKRDEPMACLRKRAFTVEEDSQVREAMLTVLKSSPNQGAADILCDAIPFWMKNYVVEEIPDKIPGTAIVQAQNDRDWERSYECYQKALRQTSGWSCFARMHVGLWFREVGGQTYVPKCPGYEEDY